MKAATRTAVRPGELALLLLAAIHDKVPFDDRDLQAAIKKLSSAKPKETYDIALRLLVMDACPSFPERSELAKQDAHALLSNRSSHGAFQYRKNPSTWDLSNTQYGALGLRAANALGVRIESAVWRKLSREIGKQQTKDGGFGYSRRSSRANPSMTVAGTAVLAICRQAMGTNSKSLPAIDTQIQNAWTWMADNRSSIGDKSEKWSYYFHYGLERAAILCDVVKVGGVTDWYVKGAKMFVQEQLSGGGWVSTQDGFPGQRLSKKRGDSVPTAFAILFLRKGFRKTARPITPHVVRLVNIGKRSRDKDVDECARQLIQRGKNAIADVITGMRSDIEPRRRVAALALKGITSQTFGFDPQQDAKANRLSVRRVELWYLKNR